MIQLKQQELNKELNTADKKLIVFSAEWCGPCKILKPNLEKAEEMVEGIKIIKADVSENEDSTRDFNVKNIPTCVLINEGKEVARFHGVKSPEDIKKFILEN